MNNVMNTVAAKINMNELAVVIRNAKIQLAATMARPDFNERFQRSIPEYAIWDALFAREAEGVSFFFEDGLDSWEETYALRDYCDREIRKGCDNPPGKFNIAVFKK